MTYIISFLTTMHNAGIHFEYPKRRSISSMAGIQALPSLMFLIIIISITMFGLKILFNNAMEKFSYYRLT